MATHPLPRHELMPLNCCAEQRPGEFQEQRILIRGLPEQRLIARRRIRDARERRTQLAMHGVQEPELDRLRVHSRDHVVQRAGDVLRDRPRRVAARHHHVAVEQVAQRDDLARRQAHDAGVGVVHVRGGGADGDLIVQRHLAVGDRVQRDQRDHHLANAGDSLHDVGVLREQIVVVLRVTHVDSVGRSRTA